MSDPLFNDPLPIFRLERHGPVIELVLARPARHNALDADLMQGLLDCLDELAQNQPSPTAPTCCCCAPRACIFARAPILEWMRKMAGGVRPRAFDKNSRGTPGCWPT